MLVETCDCTANLGASQIVRLSLDELGPVIAALMDPAVRRTSVHAASKVCRLLINALVVNPLDLARVEWILDDALDEQVRVGLKAQPALRLSYSTGARTLSQLPSLSYRRA